MQDRERIAANLRRARQAAGFSQSQLAEKLFLTPQTISKWETGASQPSLSNLSSLSDLLCVTADDLLRGDLSTAGSCCIAIDGGGTKTEFVSFSAEGHIFGRAVLGGSNPNTYGLKAVLALLHTGIEKITVTGHQVRAVQAGISGCGVFDRKEELLKSIQLLCPEAKILITSDIGNVFALAGMEKRGIAVISGTGSSAFAKDEAGLHRVGGWGYLLDFAGSGYDLGRDALAHTLSVEDGMTPPSALSALVTKKAQGRRISDCIPELYASTRDGIASYSASVLEACAAGDSAADAILQKNILRLKELVEYLAKTYSVGKTAVFSGGVTKNPLFRERMKAALPEIRVLFPDEPQIYGAAVAALRSEKLTVTPSFHDTFMKEYKEICHEQN